ncbi:carboxypeptidase regulatory-like domain-containing protein [bacterium]|nr:carboxypeptidase regulatory-like domain-containing protein [bacterium]
MNGFEKLNARFLAFLCVFFLITSPSKAEEYIRDQLVAVFLDGPVFFNHSGQKDWKPMVQGQTLIDGDAVRTGNHGYLVLAYSSDNLLLVKPKSGLRFSFDYSRFPVVLAMLYDATVLLSVRDSKSIQVLGRNGTLFLEKGEATYQSNKNHDEVHSLHGVSLFRMSGNEAPTQIPEGYGIEFDPQGRESALTPFDTRMEYDGYRRFNTYLRNFDVTNKLQSTDITYKIDSVMVNEVWVSNMEIDMDGYRIIDPGADQAPKEIHLKVKITPIPRPADQFEVYINKDLVYVLQDAGTGYFEAKFPVPTFPEFFVKIHSVDSLGRRDRIFESRFVIYNRHRKIEEIRAFLTQLSMAFSRRDLIYLRDHISRDYKDWYGNTYFNFTQFLEDTLRTYRDIRLTLHPHTFKFRGTQVQVNMNYRLTALTGNWTYRYEDLGSELMTLTYSNGEWQIRSKAKGMFLQRMRAAVDLRSGILRGRVINEASQSPLRGATVKLLKTRFKTTTDSMGEYIIYNVPPGKYDIEIVKNGFGKITITQVEVVPTGERF